MAKLIAG